MKRLCSALLAPLLLASALCAQSAVWKVTRNGHTLFLGGTCHYLRATDLPLPPEFDAAFAQAASVWFETDLAELQSPATQQKLATQAFYTDGSSLDTKLSPEAWKLARDWCAKAGLPPAQVRLFKPWMLMMTIMGVELQRLSFTPEGVDVQYQRKAASARKRTGQLETVDQQIEFLTHLGEGAESELIVSTLLDLDRLPAVLGDIVAAWRGGDLAKLDELLSREMRQNYPGIHAALIANRNKAWLPKLETMLADTPQEFVLVGTAHLAGDDGLVALLRQKGCTVEQLRITPAPVAP